jgi:crossover junction endodeoxyribonuclease RuvC
MTVFLGIDPGLTGALCWYNPEVPAALEIADVPTLKVRGKTVIDHYSLARFVDSHAAVSPEVWIEFVSSSPQMGVSSSFSFGQTYGLLIGVCAAHFLKINTVTPAQWKLAMKARGEKDEARARACAEFPRHSHLFARVKDHGRAEAALIALYGARQHEGGVAA